MAVLGFGSANLGNQVLIIYGLENRILKPVFCSQFSNQNFRFGSVFGLFAEGSFFPVLAMIHYLKNKVGVVDFANAQGVVMF